MILDTKVVNSATSKNSIVKTKSVIFHITKFTNTLGFLLMQRYVDRMTTS